MKLFMHFVHIRIFAFAHMPLSIIINTTSLNNRSLFVDVRMMFTGILGNNISFHYLCACAGLGLGQHNNVHTICSPLLSSLFNGAGQCRLSRESGACDQKLYSKSN